jgi:hypothetical protein
MFTAFDMGYLFFSLLRIESRGRVFTGKFFRGLFADFALERIGCAVAFGLVNDPGALIVFESFNRFPGAQVVSRRLVAFRFAIQRKNSFKSGVSHFSYPPSLC